jgi:hypothetical protein
MADYNEHFCGPTTDADNITKNVSDMDIVEINTATTNVEISPVQHERTIL